LKTFITNKEQSGDKHFRLAPTASVIVAIIANLFKDLPIESNSYQKATTKRSSL